MATHTLKLTLDPRFNRLLTRQDQLQAFLLAQQVQDMDPQTLAAYIRTQAYAMIAETVEAVDETHWKPWATPPQDGQIVPNKARYVGELADVFIFFMNLMIAGDITMSQLAEAVDAKQTKNLMRWTNGYDAKATKCKGCKRSYDDPEVHCYPAAGNDEPKASNVLAFCADRERFIDGEGNTV